MKRQTVTIYTDGSCHGNPGPGGYAAVVLQSGVTREVHGSDWHTTNNRMELTAVIQGLKLLPEPCEVLIRSDSQYVVKPIQRGNLKDYVNTPNRTNADLWQRILRLSAIHHLSAEWVKGHSGNRWNQRCDTLANREASQVEREKPVRLCVFQCVLADIQVTPEQIACRYDCDLETVKKYYRQYFERLSGYGSI